jgi:hypothetical protein
MNSQIFTLRFCELYLNILTLSCKLNSPCLMLTSCSFFQNQLFSILRQTIITKTIHKFHTIGIATINEPKLFRVILVDRSKLNHRFLFVRLFGDLKSKLKTLVYDNVGALRIKGHHVWQLRLYMIKYQFTISSGPLLL